MNRKRTIISKYGNKKTLDNYNDVHILVTIDRGRTTTGQIIILL